MSLVVPDACWSWFSDPRVLLGSNGDYYIGFADASGDPGVARLYMDTGIVQRKGGLTAYGADDHNNPALHIVDPSNKLLISCADHNGIGNTRLSFKAFGASFFNPFGGTALDENQRSYSRLIQVADNNKTIYTFAREDPTTGESIFNTSTDGGVTFSATRTQWLTNSTRRPYKQFALSADGLRIDYIATNDNPSDFSGDIWHGYVEIDPSDGSREWFKGDTTSVGDDTQLPLDLGTDLTKIYNGTSTNSWVWDLRWINGTLYAAATYFDNTSLVSPGVHHYMLGTYDGDSWTWEDICDGGGTANDYLYSAQPHYSGGITLTDNPNVVYVSRKYGATDFRIEQWTKGGSWSKTVDVSGNTSSVNARPTFAGSHCWYWRGTYTSYTSYLTDVHVYPDITINSSYTPVAKPTSPALQPSGVGYDGLTGLWDFRVGTGGAGTTIDDLSVESRDGTVVGTPTWASGSYGPELAGFSTSNYVSVDAAGDLIDIDTAPYAFAVLFKNSGTTDGVAFGQGRNSSSVPFIAAGRVNSGGSAGVLEFDVRGDDNSLKNIQESSVGTNDGSYQVVFCVIPGTTRIGQFYASGTNLIEDRAVITAPGNGTFDRSSIGALVRNTVTLPFPGTIVAVARWNGDFPDPGELAHDWLSGAFSVIRAADTGNLLLRLQADGLSSQGGLL